MLTESTVIDKIEIVGEFKHVQVRQATVIERDGVEISRAYHRYVIAPTDDITSQPDEVKAVCNAVRTTLLYKYNSKDCTLAQRFPAPIELEGELQRDMLEVENVQN